MSLEASSQYMVSPTPPEDVSEKDKKTIKVYPDVHEALGEFGQWGDSYDMILRRLINFAIEKGLKKQRA